MHYKLFLLSTGSRITYGLILLLWSALALAETRSTAIFEVITRGEVTVLQDLVKRGINPNTPAADFEGKTPMMYAVAAGDIPPQVRIAMLQLLLEAGANINATTRFGVTVLTQAMLLNDQAVLDWLIQHGADVNHLTSFRAPSVPDPSSAAYTHISLVMWCAVVGDIDCLNLALQRGGNPFLKNDRGEDALSLALASHKETAARAILKAAAAKTDIKSILNSQGYLVIAAELGLKLSTLLLLEAGAKPDAKGYHPITPLAAALRAARFNAQDRHIYLEIVKLLLKAGADLSFTNPKLSYLTSAIKTHDPAFVKALLVYTPNNVLKDNDWFLKRAISITEADPAAVLAIVQLLADHGANKKALGINEQNMLSLAAHNNPYLVPLVIEWGLDINQRDKFGSTPLHYAADNAEEAAEIIPLLIKRGATVNVQNMRGWTALMYAARRGSLLAVKILLQAGADVHLQSSDGNTALNIAETALPPFRAEEIISVLHDAQRSP